MTATFSIEEWNEGHPRWHEFINCLETVAPDQVPFVVGKHYHEHWWQKFKIGIADLARV